MKNTDLKHQVPHWWKKVRLVIIKPAGFSDLNSMSDLIDLLFYSFKRLGIEVDIAENEVILAGVNIIFFSFFVDNYKNIPINSIIFNSEQITDDSKIIPLTFYEQIKHFTVWDYSKKNIEKLKNIPGNNIQFFKIGHAPEITRIQTEVIKDIDVLFYGALNSRRQFILDKLIHCGFNVVMLKNSYGVERDKYIARSKIVLNIHYYESKILEIVRLSYLLSNKICIVSEVDIDTEIDDELKEIICGVPYNEIVSTCIDLLTDESKRKNFELKGYEYFCKVDQSYILLDLINESCYIPQLPLIINIGSGKSWNPIYLNVDINPICKPDMIVDLSNLILFDIEIESERFGKRKLPQNYFHEIIVHDVLEHVLDLVSFIGNCKDLLIDGGIMNIIVPYDLSYGAWQDPTHLRAFNEKSWLYYTDWFWYIGWKDARFDMISIEYILSDYGKSLEINGDEFENILRMPRAVDSMHVILKKRLLTDFEKLQGNHFLIQNR